jgi:DNA-binding NarL/FixJ family response regulator
MINEKKTHIIFLSNNSLMTEGIKAIFSRSDEFELIALCHNPSSPAQNLAGYRADMLLMDCATGANLSMLREVCNVIKHCQIVLWGDGIAPEFASHAVELGVRAIIPADVTTDVFLEALRSVRDGQFWFTKQMMEYVLLATRYQLQLTRREGQLITLLCRGLKNKEIACTLGLSDGTVKVYLSRIFKKVGVNDRFQLALYALRNVLTTQGAGLEMQAAEDPEFPADAPHGLRSLVMPPPNGGWTGSRGPA